MTPSNVGSQATNSLEPIVGSTSNGSTVTWKRRTSDPAIASRSSGVPCVVG